MIKLDSTRSDEELILDVGCGESKITGSVGLDVRSNASVDVVGDARNLPFDDNMFDRVYASHVIEHFSHTEVDRVVAEWVRVTRKGGVIELRCPYLRIRSAIYALSGSEKQVVDIYGGQDHEFNHHKNGFGFGSLRRLLNTAGVEDVSLILDGYKGIPFLPEDLHVEGIVR